MRQQMELEDFENFISRQLLSRLQRATRSKLRQAPRLAGIDLKRTDHKKKISSSPDELFLYDKKHTNHLIKRIIA